MFYAKRWIICEYLSVLCTFSLDMQLFVSIFATEYACADNKPYKNMQTDLDKEMMREAIRLSAESVKNGGGPFGAVIAKDGEIVARASNSVTILNDPTAHAEVMCIREACRALGTFNLSGCSIYTSCEPCPMCLGAIYWARLDRIYYANNRKDAADIDFDDDFIYRELERPLSQRSTPIIPLLRNEALPVFKAWTLKTDKTEY
jgi:tRNA(Arg) A34 adenosine deaminase TadA